MLTFANLLLLSIAVIYAKCIHAPPLCYHWSFTMLFTIQCSFQMFSTSKFCHTSITLTPFMVFQCTDQFVQVKSGCCLSKIFHQYCQRSIVLNNRNLKHILSNKNIWIFILNSLADRPLRIHISGKVFFMTILCPCIGLHVTLSTMK